MSWIELQLDVPRRVIGPVSAALFEAGAVGVHEDFRPGEAPAPRQPWDQGPAAALPERALLRVWWEANSEQQALAAVDDLQGRVPGLGPAEWSPVEQEDWAEAWRSQCVRVVVTEGLAVAPPWKAESGDLVIEPGMAFGSGDHPTTLSCLRRVLQHAVPGERCLDVGTGSGVLAIAAARLGMVCWGVDIEPHAIEAARENADRNQVSLRADNTPLALVTGSFELVVANLFAEVLVDLSDDLKRVCSRRLVVAGVLADRAETVIEALSPMKLEVQENEGDWCHLGFVW